MRGIFGNHKKAQGQEDAQAAAAPEVKGMEISDMKRQILETLKKREQEAVVIESEKPAVSRQEMLKAIEKPAAMPQVEERIVIKADEELLKRFEKLKAELERKDSAIQDLEKRLKEESSRAAITADMLKARDNKRADADKLFRELEGARKLVETERVKHENLRLEYKSALLARDETAKLLKNLRSESDAKEKSIQGLQKKVEKMGELEEALRVRDKRVADADRLSKELEASRKVNEEYRMKMEAAQAETKALAAMHAEATGHHGKLKEELNQKDSFAQDLQKKFTAEINEITREKDRAVSNVESLRSKLYTAAKEAKEQLTKIAQFEESIRIKDKRMAELDKLNAELSAGKSDIESKFHSAESANKDLNERYARFNDELAAGIAKMGEMEKAYRELEASYGDASRQLQVSLRGSQDLETKLAQTLSELEARTARLTEADKLYKELDFSAHELTSKLQASQLRAKELEASNEDLALQLSNANRDKKDLELRIAELRSETEAKTIRLENVDKARNELEATAKDVEAKFLASQRRVDDLEKEAASLAESLKSTPLRLKEVEDAAKNDIERLSAEVNSLKNMVKQKEKNEIALQGSIEQLEVEMQARDSKIEGDFKYTEKIVKEINELRKKLAALQRQPERTKSAGD